MGVLSNLEPKEVFEQFEALSMVPRRTYRDEKISDYCVEFAKKHGLEYVQQESGNVIIYKPGTAGYEDSEPVILQGHMDMVPIMILTPSRSSFLSMEIISEQRIRLSEETTV